jgi:hypothetical protein
VCYGWRVIRTSLEFAPGTPPNVKALVQSIPAYDLLVAYRKASYEFNTTDIVLIVAAHDEEVRDFQAMPRSAYVARAMNESARLLHPVARESAHQKMKMPPDSPAFWVVLELHNKGVVVPCAIGSYKYEAALDETTSN